MNLQKIICKIFVVLAVAAIFPVSAFAIADFGAFGGYSFSNKIEETGGDTNVKGWQYGLYGHVNTGIPMVATLGIGGFYLIAPLKGDDVDATKKSVGVDAYAQLDLPFLPVFPYARYGIAINEKFEVKAGGATTNLSENFKSHYFGFGLSRNLLNAGLLKFQIFAEYLFTTSKQEKDVTIKGNAINVGIKAII
jgi:hypothetical protein